MSSTITAHCLVKNEARFIWYSIMSVIKYVDKLIIFDTGSTDGTLDFINEIKKTPEAKGKIIFEIVSGPFVEEIRQKMLDITSTDWFVVVDADEIWWDESIKKIIDTINEKGSNLETIIVPFYNLVGDIFHYQEKSAGRYHLAGKIGNLGLKAVNRRIRGLHGYGPHGKFAWIDEKGVSIENRNSNKILFLDTPYLHATHLVRSGNLNTDKLVYKRSKKRKHELGIPFPSDFYYPEVFFRLKPRIVPSAWEIMSFGYKFRAFFETPLRKFYRRSIMRFKEHGY